LEELRNLIEEARTRNGHVLDPELSYVVKNRMERMMNELAAHPEETERMTALDQLAQLVMPLPLGLNLWKVQNTFWGLLQSVAGDMRARAAAGDEAAQRWTQQFTALGTTLGFVMRPEQPAEAATKMAA
jgi:hypothetical protein